jgi:hypothetical protein
MPFQIQVNKKKNSNPAKGLLYLFDFFKEKYWNRSVNL